MSLFLQSLMTAIETYGKYLLLKYVSHHDPSKKAQEVIFYKGSRRHFIFKFEKLNYAPLYFNNSFVKEYSKQKHLEIILIIWILRSTNIRF